MINFCIASSGPYRGICEAIIDPIREHLSDSTICRTEQSGATNVGFFVTRTNCQVFIPHGIADKNYRNADKVNAFEYVFVSGPAWVDKLVRQGFPRDRILVGGYTKLDPVFQGKYEQTRRTFCVILYAPTHGAIPEVSLDGREVVETGTAGKEWAKRFGKESSEPYLVYCLAQKKVGREEWQTEKNNSVAEFAIPEE